MEFHWPLTKILRQTANFMVPTVLYMSLSVFASDPNRLYSLRDSSILPGPICGHPQATLYAVAEQVAEIILG